MIGFIAWNLRPKTGAGEYLLIFSPCILLRSTLKTFIARNKTPGTMSTPILREKNTIKTLQAIPEEVETIWEIGCGEGVFTQLLLEKGKIVRGVDISPSALSRARERLKDFDDRVRLQKLDIVREDIEGTFDLILASEILYYLGGKDVLQPLEEKFFRHLRPFWLSASLPFLPLEENHP